MKRRNDLTQMKEFVAQGATGRNRYRDVGCLDNRRVILKIGKVPYIHANYVATPNRPNRFICTQEKSEAILMLCNFLEQFQFPFETKVQVRMRALEVQVPGQRLHSCIHYHWLDWPDRGVPEVDLSPIALLSKLKNSCGPIIVHCSAGIGRTGSIVLIQHALELIHRHEPLLEMRGYLIELRKQRNNSVQTEQQYLYVHQVLLQYLKRTKYMDENVSPLLEQFTKDYLQATRGF
ncbi:Protein-tyrosine phosphatase [Necator americanus]|uniref:Protein-tyrosine phosphatase n=1 Tax=Necator americanus TaxID=51031 RepID=W2TL53_NECAM|nr:Protein-tyrosine phosphatase [Necator americanus]ETN82523.1 Protein-tyrosine phosphatase [Necator americanus]